MSKIDGNTFIGGFTAETVDLLCRKCKHRETRGVIYRQGIPDFPSCPFCGTQMVDRIKWKKRRDKLGEFIEKHPHFTPFFVIKDNCEDLEERKCH